MSLSLIKHDPAPAEAVGAFVGGLIAAAGIFAFVAWLVMLCLGAAHSADPRVPALGYECVLWLDLAVGLLVGSGAKAAKASA